MDGLVWARVVQEGLWEVLRDIKQNDEPLRGSHETTRLVGVPCNPQHNNSLHLCSNLVPICACHPEVADKDANAASVSSSRRCNWRCGFKIHPNAAAPLVCSHMVKNGHCFSLFFRRLSHQEAVLAFICCWASLSQLAAFWSPTWKVVTVASLEGD